LFAVHRTPSTEGRVRRVGALRSRIGHVEQGRLGMDKVNERDMKQKDKASRAKPGEKKPIGGEQQKEKDQWPPSSGPGERSDKDAIGRPVQLDKD
jgi:hypothetical protein